MIGSEFFNYDIGENDCSGFGKLEVIAELHYTVMNDVVSSDDLPMLFDCDITCEIVHDDGITYYWFNME